MLLSFSWHWPHLSTQLALFFMELLVYPFSPSLRYFKWHRISTDVWSMHELLLNQLSLILRILCLFLNQFELPYVVMVVCHVGCQNTPDNQLPHTPSLFLWHQPKNVIFSSNPECNRTVVVFQDPTVEIHVSQWMALLSVVIVWFASEYDVFYWWPTSWQ